MRKRYLVWGGGGHGKVVADLIRLLGDDLVGAVDRDATKVGQVVEPGGMRVVAAEGALLQALVAGDRHPLGADAIAVAIGDNAGRQRCLELLGAFPAPPLVHPLAACSAWAELGRGTVVFAQAVVNTAARLGAAVIVNSGAVVEHDCTIATAAHLAPGAVLGGGVQVGARSWIGAGATVRPGVRIGQDVIVGAGAVIVRDVPDGVTIVGNPGRELHRDT